MHLPTEAQNVQCNGDDARYCSLKMSEPRHPNTSRWSELFFHQSSIASKREGPKRAKRPKFRFSSCRGSRSTRRGNARITSLSQLSFNNLPLPMHCYYRWFRGPRITPDPTGLLFLCGNPQLASNRHLHSIANETLRLSSN